MLYFKCEDLLYGGVYKINQVLGQVLLVKWMGKIEIIVEIGVGQYGVVSVFVSVLFGLKCCIYMGVKDVERQLFNVFCMCLMGVEVILVYSGFVMLKDVCNEVLCDWFGSYEIVYYMLGIVVGLYFYLIIVCEFQWMIGEEIKVQILEREGCLLDVVIVCVGGGLNVIGMFVDFINEINVGLIGVELGGYGIEIGEYGVLLKYGCVGIYFGMKVLMM